MRMLSNVVAGAIALVAIAAAPNRAHAQASPQAESLFRDGKQLMKDGKLAEACAAFEGSEHVEHNLATLLSLADCREKNQQYASAWANFLQADSLTRNDPAKAMLNATAKSRAVLLEPKLSYLTINVPDESRIEGLSVTRDGLPVDPAEWNRAIPADGGKHVIAGKAPGHEPWQTTVTVGAEQDKQSVEVPKFKALPVLLHRDRTAPPEPSPFTTRRKIGIGVAAGGLAVAGVAVYLGLDARNLRNEAVATCPPSSCSPSAAIEAQDKNDRAREHGLYANIGFAAGGALVATGAVLWFLGAPESNVRVAPTVGATNGVAILGRF